jgi:CSLREA domain-containing protein
MMQGLLGLFACLVWVLAAALPSGATTFTVDTTRDVADANPGDGACAGDQGGCSLRAAIQETNALSGADTINLPSGTYKLKIAAAGENFGASGDLDILGDLTINGSDDASTIVDGNGLDRVFDVRSGATVQISSLTIQNGKAPQGENGGGVFNQGHLRLTDVTLKGNVARVDPLVANGRGGAIFNAQDLTLTDSTLSGNVADGPGGGIENAGTMSVANTTLRGNTSKTDKGGAIENRGTLNLLISTVTGNRAGQDGGGINNLEGTMRIADSTIDGNQAEASGGGVRSSGSLTITNSTISGNTARASGGGLSNFGPGTAELDNVTIARNTAHGAGGGVSNATSSTLRASNTLIAANTGDAQQGPDCSGTLSSLGHNLLQVAAGCTVSGDTASNLVGQDPKLGPLSDGGGPTRVHPLLVGSPAIDAGNPGPCDGGAGRCDIADQRGVGRPVDGSGRGTPICDIGAYELKPKASAAKP